MASLLAPASEGRGIPIDYDESDLDLRVNVIEACHESACICSFRLIEKVLGIPTCLGELEVEPVAYLAELVMKLCRLLGLSSVEDALGRTEYNCIHCRWRHATN
jgi:hypothetical protein